MADNYKIRLIGELDAETTTSDIKKQLEGIKIKANILEGGFTAESIEKLSEQISNAVDAYQKKSEKSYKHSRYGINNVCKSRVWWAEVYSLHD